MIDLEPHENVVAIVRKHWFIFLIESLAPIIAFFIILFAVELASAGVLYFNTDILIGSGTPFAAFIIFFAFIFAWIALFAIWTNYYLDYWVLTTMRVIDVEQVGLFSRRVSSFAYERVQDMTVDIHGVIPTLLNFGTLHVETAGERPLFKLPYAPNPHALKKMIHAQYLTKSGAHQTSGL